MDTFSRRLLWLRVYNSNKDPFVVGSYFYDFISDENGNVCVTIAGNQLFSTRLPISVFLIFSLVFPVRTRTDYGVEVTILAQCQIFLRRHHLDAFAFDNAHYHGRSELNQVSAYAFTEYSYGRFSHTFFLIFLNQCWMRST